MKNTAETNSKLFVFDSVNEQWELPKIKGTGPGLMDEHTAVMREDGKMYLFGGFGDNGELKNDVFSFNANNSTWQYEDVGQGNRPEPRAGHTAVMLKTKMYVFAGKGPNCIKYNDIWVFDTNQTNWSKVKVKETIESVIPEGRSGHSMFQFRGKLLVYGGMQSILKEMSDLCLYDTLYHTWAEIIQS